MSQMTGYYYEMHGFKFILLVCSIFIWDERSSYMWDALYRGHKQYLLLKGRETEPLVYQIQAPSLPLVRNWLPPPPPPLY